MRTLYQRARQVVSKSAGLRPGYIPDVIAPAAKGINVDWLRFVKRLLSFGARSVRWAQRKLVWMLSEVMPSRSPCPWSQ